MAVRGQPFFAAAANLPGVILLQGIEIPTKELPPTDARGRGQRGLEEIVVKELVIATDPPVKSSLYIDVYGYQVKWHQEVESPWTEVFVEATWDPQSCRMREATYNQENGRTVSDPSGNMATKAAQQARAFIEGYVEN